MKYQGEAIVLVTHDDGAWDISVPRQIVEPAHLEYRRVDKVTPVGTIHSHCNMGAFFSGTADNDVASFDGLHIVLGRISLPFPEIASAVYINGRMFGCRPQDIIGGMPGHSEGKSKKHPWLKHVKSAERQFPFNEGDHVPDFPGRKEIEKERAVDGEVFGGLTCPLCGRNEITADPETGEAKCMICGETFGVDEALDPAQMEDGE